MKEVLQQYWYVPVILLVILVVGLVLLFAFRKSEIIRKYGFIFFIVYASMLVFFLIKLLAKSARDQSPVLGIDISLAIGQLKKMISENKILRDKALEKIGGETKIKSDLEARIENFFDKYLNH